jgi:16S rRNA (adenine1518-N6/adenine1519-N6)-dimethyltransferase
MDDGAQSRAAIRALLDRHGVRPDRNYGQNFLADPNIVRKIVATADVGEGRVIEVGAGTGSLTSVLAAGADRVVAYEVDADLLPILAETVSGRPNVEIRNADASTVSLGKELDGEPWILVANLPYNVGTGILLDTLRHSPTITRFVVMVQTEVADRLLASPGSRTYGLPSVVVGLHARGRRAFSVPPQVFEPAPTVGSAVVVLDREPADPRSERAIQIAAAAFGQRRKMLRRSLAGVVADPTSVLEAAGIDPTARAEHIAPGDYLAIASEERAG